MKKVSIKSLIIALLCITIILLAIGFCVLSVRLDSLNKKETSFDVSFKNIKEETTIKGGTNVPICKAVITDDGLSIDMDCKLYTKGDEVAYTITMINNGNLDAKLIKLINNNIDGLSIKTTTIENRELSEGEEIKIKVVVTNNETNKLINGKYKLSLLTKSK